ncbi:hypothetical protein [Streptococcus orisasini]
MPCNQWIDLKGTGVHVTEIQPGSVATDFENHSQQSADSFSALNPLKKVEITGNQCARESIKALKKNKALHYPGW